MSIQTKICSKCGTTYQYDDGFFAPSEKCPTCYQLEEQKKSAEEAQRQQREAREKELSRLEEFERERVERERESLEEQRYIAEQLAEEQRRTAEKLAEKQREIARNSWKLQAQAKVDRAFKLIETKLFEEAIGLLQEAIKEDPGNLQAHQGIAWAFHQTKQDKKAIESLKKQLLLLKSDENSDSPYLPWTAETIKAVQPNEDLWDDFSEIVVNHLSTPINLIIYLANNNELEKARCLYNKIIDNKKPLVNEELKNKDDDVSIIRGVLLIQPDEKQWEGFLSTTANNLYDAFSAVSWLLDESEVEKACSLYDATIALAENYVPQIVVKELKLLLRLLTANTNSNLDWNKDNQAWESFIAKTEHWSFEPSELLYEILDIAHKETALSLFNALESPGKISRLFGFAIGAELNSQQAESIVTHYLRNKGHEQRESIINEFVAIKSKEKLSHETLARVQQSILNWYGSKQLEIDKELQKQAKSIQANQPGGGRPPIYSGGCQWGLGIGLLLSGCICVFGYFLSLTMSSREASNLIQNLAMFVACLSLPVIGGTTTFLVPLITKSAEEKKALSKLQKQEKVLLDKISI